MKTGVDNKDFFEALKKPMGKIEPILLIVYLALVLLKTSGLNFPITSILLVSIGGTLSMVYLIYFGTIKKTIELSTFFYATIKISYLSLSILIIGTLYKIQFWPGSFITLLGGSVLGVIGAFGLYYFKNNWDAYEPIINLNQLFKRLLGTLVIGLLLLSVGNKELFRIINKDNPEKVKLYELMIDNPDDEVYRKAFQEYIRRKN